MHGVNDGGGIRSEFRIMEYLCCIFIMFSNRAVLFAMICLPHPNDVKRLFCVVVVMFNVGIIYGAQCIFGIGTLLF